MSRKETLTGIDIKLVNIPVTSVSNKSKRQSALPPALKSREIIQRALVKALQLLEFTNQGFIT